MVKDLHEYSNEIFLGTAGVLSIYFIYLQVMARLNISKVKNACKEVYNQNSTIIVTGANTGIGYATATILAGTGAEVILACRDEKKAEAAVLTIQKATGNTKVKFERLDLSDIQSVKQFAERVHRCHLLVNNAGLFSDSHTLLYSKYEKTIFTNYLGPWYLTHLLLPKLQKTSKQEGGREVRVVNVGSRLEKFSVLRKQYHDQGSSSITKVLQDREAEFFSSAYATSKLGNTLFTYELARRLRSGERLLFQPISEGSAGVGREEDLSEALISVNVVTPGIVNTDISRFLPSWLLLLTTPIRALLLKTPEMGGAEVAFVATLSDETGKYFGERTLLEDLSQRKEDELELAKDLWTSTELLVQDLLKEEAKKNE